MSIHLVTDKMIDQAAVDYAGEEWFNELVYESFDDYIQRIGCQKCTHPYGATDWEPAFHGEYCDPCFEGSAVNVVLDMLRGEHDKELLWGVYTIPDSNELYLQIRPVEKMVDAMTHSNFRGMV